MGTNNPFSPGTGSANNFAGTVTLETEPDNSTTGFSTVELRNVSPTASVLTGLTDVGTLSGVYLTYDYAPSVSLPAMTIPGTSGNLYVYAPSVLNTATTPTNIVSQAGPIVVGGNTTIEAGSTGDVVLANTGNDFNYFGVVQSRNTTVNTSGSVILYAAPGDNEIFYGNLSVTAGGNITDHANNIQVQSGTASFVADNGAGNISLTSSNYWNVVMLDANNVTINPWTGLIFGASTVNGTLSMTSANTGYSLTQLADTAVNMTGNGTTTFSRFTGGITLNQPDNVFGPLSLTSDAGVNIAENAPITQASAWSDTSGFERPGHHAQHVRQRSGAPDPDAVEQRRDQLRRRHRRR
jgi:hypothetical protein